MLRRQVILLACDEQLRIQLGENLKKYLENVVSWDIVARQYYEAYEMARKAKRNGKKIELEMEF